MAKPLNDSALIKTISASKTPMTADQIAVSMKTLRHKVVPLLRGLVSTSQIVEVPATDEFPVRFSYRQSGDGLQEQPGGKVVQISSSRRPDEEAVAKQSAVQSKPAEKPVAKKLGRPSLKSVAAGKAPAGSTIVEKAAAEKPSASTAPATAATVAASKPASTSKAESPKIATNDVASSGDDVSMYSKVLRMLGEEPTKREDILMELGPIGLLIDEMKEKGVIHSSYLFDSHVLDLTEAGQLELENLPELPKAAAETVASNPISSIAEPESKSSHQTSVALEDSVSEGDQTSVAQVDASAQSAPAQPEIEAPTAVPAPEASSIAKQTALTEAKAPAASSSEQALPENPIMVEMAALMEKLVNERMGKLAQKLEQGDRDREALVNVGASIKKATAALQIALDALNEIGDSIS